MLIHRNIAVQAEQLRRTLIWLLILAGVLTVLGVTGVVMILNGVLRGAGF